MTVARPPAPEAAPLAERPPAPARERRMHAHAFAHWEALRGRRACPPLAELDPRALPEAAPHSFLAAIGRDGGLPRLHFIGAALAEEAGLAEGEADLARLPRAALIAQLARQLPRIAERGVPLAFEYDGPGAGGAPTHHRGILLPFADADGAIAYVQAIVGWRRIAGAEIALDCAAAIAASLDLAPPAAQPCAWSVAPANAAAPLTPAQHLATARTWIAFAAADRARAGRNLAAALSATHDLLLAADADPAAFDALGAPVSDDPLLQAIDLVFGAAAGPLARARHRAVLAHARRLGLGQGRLLPLIERHPGGIRAIAGAEARVRRLMRGGLVETPIAGTGRVALAPIDADYMRAVDARRRAAARPGTRATG